jgi:hypothetical protein
VLQHRTASHPPEATTDFVYPDEQPETFEVRECQADALRKFLHVVWGGKQIRHDGPETSIIRLAAITAVIAPDILGNKTLEQISQRLGCKRQNLSKTAKKITESLGLHFRRQKRSQRTYELL